MSSPASGYTTPDEAARRRAIATDQSFLVQAPAGSGKTELLIQRFLALLALVPAPEGVVAITFTRKAMGEMQDRVLATLRRAEAGDVPETPHERLSYDLALRALEQDRRVQWNLLDHPSRLRIQTIDSLCASITRQMPWLARLGAQPAVTEDADPLYLEAARRTLAQIEEDTPQREALESVLSHLDNNVPRTGELIVGMLRIRDQWLPLVASGDVRREDLELAMRNALTAGLARASALVPEELRPVIVELASFAAGNLEPEHPLAVCRALTGWPDTSTEDHAVWIGLTNLLLIGDGAWRRAVNKLCGFPAPTSVKIAALSRTYRERKEQCEGLLNALRPNQDLHEALLLIRALPPARYTDDQWRLMRALFDVLKLAVAHLKLVFRERGEVDFCEVAEGARRALGEAEAPLDLAFGLDARIQHLLVDEFQDTSVAQFELLEKLTAGWEPGDGRTLFLVGDPMQSVYRFRQAEVGLFLKTADGAIGQISPEYLRLNANHRSVPGIVERVNEIFSRIFPAANDIGTGAITYNASIPTRPAGAEEAVTVHAFRKGEDRAEAALVSQLVRDARTAHPEGSVAVLVRARTHLPEIVAALKRDGLPFRAIDIDRLGERTAVCDLLALTRAMLHLADRPSWLAILRAPWCGLTLADLHALVDGKPGATVWELLGGDLPALFPEGQQRVLRLRRTLEAAFAERGRWPLRRWVERAWATLGGPACLATDDDLRDADDYFNLLERHEVAADLPDFDGFRSEAEDLFAQPDSSADGMLQLMTIHKAKGLQFDTVIVPGLGRHPRQDSAALLLSAERPQPDGGVDRLLATIRETGKDQDPVYGYLRLLEQHKNAHESVRLLYVAATRARTRLHLVGQAVRNAKGDVHPEGGSLLKHLWPGLREEERQRFRDRLAVTAEEAAVTAQPVGVPLKRLPLAWNPPPLPAPVVFDAAEKTRRMKPSYLWVGDQLRHVGTVVHAVLQRIALEGLAGFDEDRLRRERGAYRSALANLGVVPAELEAAAWRVEEALIRTLASPRGRWILAPHADARCEYAIAGVLNGEVIRGAIDRTFADEDGWCWIIDYKTSTHQGSDLAFFLDEEKRRYRDQLERYACLLAPTGRPLKLGLYFPLLDAWREWEPGDGEGRTD